MPNYLSKPVQYQNPIESFNFDLMAKALEYKQNAINENVSKAQETINSFSQIDLARDVDKQYLGDRLNALVSHVNALEGADWSSNNTSSIINSHIRQAVDKNVVTAAVSTQNLRKLQANIQHFREEETDKYNPLNEAFAMRGAEQWLSNPNVGAGYAGGVYNPYEDVNKSMLSVVKDLKDTKGDQIIEVRERDTAGNYTGRIQKKTIKGLTSDEIQAYLPNLLPPTTLQQLKINGWGKYQGNGGLQAAQNNFNEYSNEVNSRIDEQIAVTKIGENTTGISKKQKEYYTKTRQALQQKKEDFNTQIANTDTNDTAALGGFLETNQWLNNFSQIAAGRESIELEKDDVYFAQADLELANRRENRMAAESQLGMLKTQLEIQKLGQELNQNQAPVSLSPIVGPDLEDVDPWADATKEYLKGASEVNALTQQMYQGATEDQRRLFDAEKKRLTEAGVVESIANKQAAEKIFKQTNPEEFGRLLEVHTQKDNIAWGVKKAKDEALLLAFTDKDKNYFGGLQLLATDTPEVKSFIEKNKITADKLASPENADLRRQAADLMQKHREATTTIDFARLIDPIGVARPSGESPLSFTYNAGAKVYLKGTVRNPYKDYEKEIQTALKDKGYAGFTTANAANILIEKDRLLIKNSMPQTSGGYQFDEKQPMTVTKNSDGSLQISQIKEGTKQGGILSNTRTATVAQGSELYNYFNNMIQLEANKTTRLNSYTPAKKAKNIEYIDPNADDILRSSGNYINSKTGGAPMVTPSGIRVSPNRYLTTSETKKVYQEVLGGAIPQQKINTLVSLMDNNSNKFDVKAEVEKGRWITSVTLKSGVPTTLSRTDQGTEQQNADINLFVEQFPQIPVSHAVLKYLSQDPEQIDKLIQDLQ